MFLAILLSVACLTALPTFAPPSAATRSDAREAFPLGVAIPKVTTVADPQQSYALYLPAKYSDDRAWPVVYVFDPLARGPLALAQFQHSAELHGYIVAASNNSRNGPWAPEAQAADAVLNDTRQRFTIDQKRIYFAGFSGGARVASQLAQLCKCAAGVILSGAGFSTGSPPSPDPKFAVFSAVGNADFNYSEIIPLQDALGKVSLPHWLRVFDGPHEWAPPNVMDEALAWLRMQSMKLQREPGDEAFIAAQFSAAQARVSAFENSAQPLAAWRENRQIAETYETLADISAVRTRASQQEKSKEVRDALKREHSDFEEQDRLGNEVFAAAFSSPPSQTSDQNGSSQPPVQQRAELPQTDSAASAPALTRELRNRANRERKPERILVYKRALAGVFIGSLESGSNALDKKDYARAARLFACATEANPDSEWAFRNLAVARALSGDRKGALEALASARSHSKDPPGFMDWLQQEPTFERFRSSPEFRSLATASAPL